MRITARSQEGFVSWYKCCFSEIDIHESQLTVVVLVSSISESEEEFLSNIMVDVGEVQSGGTRLEFEIHECSLGGFRVSIVDEMPSENLVSMREVLNDISITCSIHVIIAVSGAMVVQGLVCPHRESAISES